LQQVSLVSSTNKTDQHDSSDILLRVELSPNSHVKRYLELKKKYGLIKLNIFDILGDPRFDVNVTVKPYIMDNHRTIGGIVNAK
jgi:predicted nucleotidyltransferase